MANESSSFCKEMEYNSFVNYFKEKYGSRLQKVVIDAGFTCPNRDGRLGVGGCTYCNNSAFHPNYSVSSKSIHWQIDEGIKFHKVRYHKAQRYIAYFQPFSNTYASLEELIKLYEQALSHPQIEGIVVGTRPDCVDEAKLDYFAQLQKEKIVVLEYGVESCYDATLNRINRGHNFDCAKWAIEQTAQRGIVQCGHFIFGLPGETRQKMLAEIDIINSLPLTAVKFHQLQIIKGTQMEREFIANRADFYSFSLEEYLDFMVEVLSKLRSNLFIDRFASEVPPRYLSPHQESWGLIRYQELTKKLQKKLKKV